MRSLLLPGASLLAMCAYSPTIQAQTDEAEPALQDVITVTGQRQVNPQSASVRPDSEPLEGPDVTRLVARTPGAARIANGALSGQVQYRGLFGERLNLRVDGQRFASGGPNLMDPVFHYAPTPLIETVRIDRGVSPVRAGPGLGGGADAVFKRLDFTGSDETKFGYDLSFGGRSVDDSLTMGGIAGAATDSWRFNLLGAWEDGDDTEFPDGTIGGTAFERGVYGLSTGLRRGGHTISLDLRRQNTGPSGNPPFPMDIRFFDTDFVRLGYHGAYDGFELEAGLNYSDVSHGMNNFDMRPAPMAMSMRETFAYATTLGADAAVTMGLGNGKLTLGLDREQAEHDVIITNPNNPDFFLNNLPDIEMTRTGSFGEWRGVLGDFEAELGLRMDYHEASAGQAVLGASVPMGPQMLANAFNASARDQEDTTVDAAMRLWTPEKDGLSWRLTLAHKMQVANYLQRYGWLPTSASGGLADGNIYVGDQALDPERALIVEAGFDYHNQVAYVRPTAYIREIDNFIQGVPYDDTIGVADTVVEMIAAMNGDPTPLRFANTDARLYGVDLDAGYDFSGPLRVDAVASYVRAERRDLDDNLYRIAPFSLTAGLTWETETWSSTLELRGVAKQDRVSLSNSEAETPGYVLVNLYADWQVREGVRLSAGVENLLDHTWRDHLSGYNRNLSGDVALGTRLPGAARGAFIRLSVAR